MKINNINMTIEQLRDTYKELQPFIKDLPGDQRALIWGYLEPVLVRAFKEGRASVIVELGHIEHSKWDNAKHCTCLGYAIEYVSRGDAWKEAHGED